MDEDGLRHIDLSELLLNTIMSQFGDHSRLGDRSDGHYGRHSRLHDRVQEPRHRVQQQAPISGYGAPLPDSDLGQQPRQDFDHQQAPAQYDTAQRMAPDSGMQQQPQVLTFRPSPLDSDTTLIDRANHDLTTTALFSMSVDKHGKDIKFFRLSSGTRPFPDPVLIGTSKSSMSSTEITIGGNHTIKLASGLLEGGYSFTPPPTSHGGGELEWKRSHGGILTLQDANKKELARYESNARSKEHSGAKLEILVAVDNALLDVTVVTSMAAVKATDKRNAMMKIGLKMVGGL